MIFENNIRLYKLCKSSLLLEGYSFYLKKIILKNESNEKKTIKEFINFGLII